jgi:hypothetical protein
MRRFSLFRVRNGWIVQIYGESTGFDGRKNSEYNKTFVFTNIGSLAAFLSACIETKR